MFKPTKRKYKALGINIYGGGFTLGVMKHFEVIGQWEEIKLGYRTFDMNFQGIYRPLNLSEWPVKETRGKVDLIYANPPCVPWSSASIGGKRTGQINERVGGKTREDRFRDPLLMLTKTTMEAALEIRPKIFVSESVENAYNVGVSHYEPYKKAWLRLGYAVTYFLTDATIHGAPCMRRWFHFIAHQPKLQLPKPPILKQPVTVRDTIGDLLNRPFDEDRRYGFQHHETSVGRFAHPEFRWTLSACQPGRRLREITSQPGYEGPKASLLMRRLKWDRPAATIVRFSPMVHPDGKRFVTWREGLRLLTYPDTFNTAGEIDAADAVMPIIADFLGGVMKRSLDKNESAKPEFNVVDWRPLGKHLAINAKP